MKEFCRKSVFWWPAILRLSIFSIMTSTGVLLAQLDGKKTSDFNGFGWVEWTYFWGPVALSWLGTKLAFLDQTLGRLREENTKIWKPGQTI